MPLYLAAGLLAFMALGSLIALYAAARSEITLEFQPQVADKNTQVKLAVKIQETIFSRPLRGDIELPPHLTASPVPAQSKANQTEILELSTANLSKLYLNCVYHGEIAINRAQFIGTDIFGLWRYVKHLKSHPKLAILPNLTQQNLAKPRSNYEEFEPSVLIRPFQVGDDLRQINWKATAKKGELMSRESDRSNAEVLLLVISKSTWDSGDLDYREKIIETALGIFDHAKANGLKTVILHHHQLLAPLDLLAAKRSLVGLDYRRAKIAVVNSSLSVMLLGAAESKELISSFQAQLTQANLGAQQELKVALSSSALARIKVIEVAK